MKLFRTASLLITTLLPLAGSAAQTASFEWARLLPGFLNEDQMLSSTMDREGNIVAAYRRAAATGSGHWRSNRVVKVDTRSGDILWDHRQLPLVLALGEKPNGSVLALGSLAYLNDSGEVSLGGQQNYFSTRGFATQGSGGGYVAQLNAQTGAIEKVLQIGTSMYVMPNSLAIMPDGGFVVSGQYFREAAQFGDTVLPRPTLTTLRNLFIARFGAEGDTRWVHPFESTGPYAISLGLAVDPSGNSIMTGSGTGAFLGRTMTNPSFLAKLAPEGTLVWIKENFPGGRPVLDSLGDIYVPHSPVGLVKYSPDGEPIWARQPWMVAVAADAVGNCVGVGSFRVADDYNGNISTGKISIGDVTLETEVEEEMFVVKYNSAGELLWVARSQGLEAAYRPFSWDGGYRSTLVYPNVVFSHPERGILIAGTLNGQALFGDSLLEGPYRKDFSSETGFFLAKIAEPASATPVLQIHLIRGDRRIALSWPAESADFVLETTATLSSPTWTEVPFAPQRTASEKRVEINVDSHPGFFRLQKR